MTKFAEAQIKGRLGAYTFELFDNEDEYDTVHRLELGRPVVIEWGEQGRDYPEQILKSRTRITVSEGASRLQKILRGGFDRRRFEGRLSGRAVQWAGFVQPESRKLPSTQRTRPNTLSLLIADDASRAKNVESTLTEIFGAQGIRQWSGELKGAELTAYDQTSADVKYGSLGTESNSYERFISFAKLMGLRLYRPLSADQSLMHELRSTGQGVSGYRLDGETVPLPGTVAEPLETSLEDRDEAFQNVDQAGTIKVNLGSNYNLIYPGASQIIVRNGDTFVGRDVDGTPNVTLTFNDSGNGEDEVLFDLGSINPIPENPLGVYVRFESIKDPIGSPSFTATLRDGNGNSKQVSGEKEEHVLKFGASQTAIDPELEIVGRNYNVVNLESFYIDPSERKVEALFDRQNPTGVEEIEIDELQFPQVPPPTGFYPDSVYAREMTHPLFTEDLGFLARAQMIRQYRPFGIQSVQTKLKGLYGPEDLLILEAPDGLGTTRRAPFVCGKGRKVNLTAGTTEISDVEIPAEILPTSVL